MTTEIFWLTLTLIMTALFWLVYVIDRLLTRGLVPTLADGQPPETGKEPSAWAKRAACAHRNAVENLVIFAPAVLIAFVLHVSTGLTQLAAETYFFARLIHFVVYTLGLPLARTLAFSVGCAAQLVILVSILHLT